MQNKVGKIAETDLYAPIHAYLTGLGYTVRSEVKDCDVTAVKGEDLIVIEMKLHFNASLLLQATQRQRATDIVYVALPKPKEGIWNKHWREICHLLKRLELGLILVSLSSPKKMVEIVFHPEPFERKKQQKIKRAIIEEFSGRTGDFNTGGSTRRKLVTAYRENSLHIACCLKKFGILTPRKMRKLGTTEKTSSILRQNFYGWFTRIERGVYELSDRGKAEIENYPELVAYYSTLLENLGND